MQHRLPVAPLIDECVRAPVRGALLTDYNVSLKPLCQVLRHRRDDLAGVVERGHGVAHGSPSNSGSSPTASPEPTGLGESDTSLPKIRERLSDRQRLRVLPRLAADMLLSLIAVRY